LASLGTQALLHVPGAARQNAAMNRRPAMAGPGESFRGAPIERALRLLTA